MIINLISHVPAIYSGEGTDEADIAPIHIFAPVLRFDDDVSTGLQEIVDRLATETRAVDSWASGLTEGTFFYNDKATALAAAKMINKHIDWVVKRSNYRFRKVEEVDIAGLRNCFPHIDFAVHVGAMQSTAAEHQGTVASNWLFGRNELAFQCGERGERLECRTWLERTAHGAVE